MPRPEPEQFCALQFFYCTCPPILVDGRILIKVEATDLAPEIRSPTYQVELPHTDSTFSLHALVWAIVQNEQPSSSSQTGSVNTVEPKRFQTAVLHGFFPFGAMMSDKAKLVADDTMTGFVNYTLSAIFFRRSGPERHAKPYPCSHRDPVVARIPKAMCKTPIPLDKNHLGQLGDFVAFTRKFYPFSDFMSGFQSFTPH
jgi:hypothetical protein